jgi:hypothetical protein
VVVTVQSARLGSEKWLKCLLNVPIREPNNTIQVRQVSLHIESCTTPLHFKGFQWLGVQRTGPIALYVQTQKGDTFQHSGTTQ